MATRSPLDKDRMWSWITPTSSSETNGMLKAAAAEVWPYALWCAWTYLHDREAAFDLMDRAIENTAGYASRLNDSANEQRFVWRMKSVLSRLAKQEARKHRLEVPYGLLVDLEYAQSQYQAEVPKVEQAVETKDILRRLSPEARNILKWTAMGYSWRQIANHLGVDRMTLRRAYDKEITTVLESLRDSVHKAK
jgi:RNA polymerase sigma factor (sigma-70 family)